MGAAIMMKYYGKSLCQSPHSQESYVLATIRYLHSINEETEAWRIEETFPMSPGQLGEEQASAFILNHRAMLFYHFFIQPLRMSLVEPSYSSEQVGHETGSLI